MHRDFPQRNRPGHRNGQSAECGQTGGGEVALRSHPDRNLRGTAGQRYSGDGRISDRRHKHESGGTGQLYQCECERCRHPAGRRIFGGSDVVERIRHAHLARSAAHGGIESLDGGHHLGHRRTEHSGGGRFRRHGKQQSVCELQTERSGTAEDRGGIRKYRAAA